MQSALRFAVTAVILLAIIGFMTMYTVRFTESAVVTTFGKADDSSVIRDPGLYFKLPYPINTVTRYDTRARYVEARPETRNTADDRQVIVTSFMTYQVIDPLKFYQAFSNAGSRPEKHYEAADDILRSKLRFALSQASKFRFEELFSVEGGTTGLSRLEAKVYEQLTTATPESPALEAYGLKATAVGISSIKLPESTSKAVFEAMAQRRLSIAQKATSRGAAEAEAIKSQAEADANKILAFAEGRAKAIRGLGQEEAAKYLAQQTADPELAIFLKNLEFMREAAAGKITLVLPQSLPGLQLLGFDALNGLAPGKIPAIIPGGSPRTGAEATPTPSSSEKDGKPIAASPEGSAGPEEKR
ncbi:MAG: SPFH domain-containing protein [Phycisphaerales bacterium]